jgi:hypothetical protein
VTEPHIKKENYRKTASSQKGHKMMTIEKYGSRNLIGTSYTYTGLPTNTLNVYIWRGSQKQH